MGSRTISTGRLARVAFGNADHMRSNNAQHAATNWGLIRHSNNANPFTSLTLEGEALQNFTYTFDDTNGQGENVDIIFSTKGMIYTDNAGYKTNGVSRIQQFDWRTLTNGFNTDVDYSTSAYRSTHSEQVIACACHNDYGAATKANIYIMPDSQGFNALNRWTLAKLFHQQKGNSNPTVVVRSAGYQLTTTQTKFYKFRGTTYRTINGGYPFQQQEASGEHYPGFNVGTAIRIKSPAYELALVKEMTDAGVHHFSSAGNTGGKLEVSGGVDDGNQIQQFSTRIIK